MRCVNRALTLFAPAGLEGRLKGWLRVRLVRIKLIRFDTATSRCKAA